MSRTENRTPPEHAKIIVERLGGTGAAAALFGIKPASVSGWKENGISELRTELIKVRRPDVFVDLEGAAETEVNRAAAAA
jgi:DNA-binding transcriptional regulator YdaS (Cro superfamily)